jgi:hypothetical protein
MARSRPLQGAALEVHKVARGATTTHRHLRDRLAAIALATVGIDLVCAVIALFVERHVKDTEIHTFGSAIFWTSTQLLTVSSQLKNPLSAGGRVLDVFMEAYAITVVATLAGAFGAFFYKRGREREAA